MRFGYVLLRAEGKESMIVCPHWGGGAAAERRRGQGGAGCVRRWEKKRALTKKKDS